MKFFPVFIATLLFSGYANAIAQAADPKGIWLTAEGDAKIRIADCGEVLCGSIAWLKQPLDPETGKPQRDKQNPDASKRTRPLLGAIILLRMRATAPNQWSGPIYNAQDGNTYEGKMSLLDPVTLRVEGCLFGVCEGENWSRTN